MNEFKNIWILAKSGFLPKEKRSLKKTVFLGLKLYGILILLKALCFAISYLLDFYDIYKMPSNITGQQLRHETPLIQFLMIAILAPVIEELTYRTGLIFSKRNLIIAIVGISYFAFKKVFELERIYCITIALIIALLLYLSLKQNAVKFLSKFWKNNRLIIFYILLLIFGLPHLTNYELTPDLLTFSIIVILPHLVAGLIYSYARLNSGLILAICVHSLNNGLPKLIKILAE